MTQRTTPPFRADMVGSLLRPAPLKEARAKFAKGEIDAAALKAVEDREIEKIIKKQAEVGFKLATDGEFRRSWWHFDFFRGLKGIEIITPTTASSSTASRPRPKACGSSARSASPAIRMIEHFKFLKAHCNVMPKMTHPGARACCISVKAARSVSKEVYPDLRRLLRRSRRRLAQGGAAPSTTPAAAICSSTTPPGR